MKLDHWFYYNLPGETIQNSKDGRNIFKLQQTPNLCNLYTELHNMKQQSLQSRKQAANM